MAVDRSPNPSDEGTKVDARIERSRAAVLGAGMWLLENEGWSSITHQRVAQEAGIGRATVYRHWPTVDELVVDVLLHCTTVGHEPIPRTGSTRSDLIAELESFAHQLSEGPVHDVIATLMERSLTNERMEELHLELTRRGRQGVWAIVEGGIEAGELDPSLDEVQAAAHTLGPLLYRRLLAGLPVTPVDVAAVVTTFFRSYGTGSG